MRWKWILGICICLIIALLAAIYVFLDTYDYNKLKPQIARMVKDATGRDLKLGGEIDLVIGFSPALVVQDVTLANAPWGSQPQMIKVETLEAQLRLLPLLFREMQVKHIGLAGVEVLLETGPKGQGNWDFIADDSSDKSIGAFQPTEIDIDNVRIEKFQLTFREGKTGSAKRFTLASLDVTKNGAEDQLTLDLKADYNRQPVTLFGKTGLIRNLFAHRRFSLQLSGSLANAAIKINGAIYDVLNLQGIALEAQLNGKNIAALGPVLDIQLPKTKEFNVTGHLKGSKESLRLDHVNGNLSGSGVDIAISGGVGNLIAFRSVDLNLKSSGKDLAEFGEIIGEKLPVTNQFEIQGRLTGSAKVLSLSGAKGSARQGGLSLALDGEIKDLLNFNGVDMVVKGSGKDLSEVGAIIEKKLPATDEFAVEGRLMGSAKALSLKDTQGRAKQGTLSVAFNGEVQDLIAFSGLDLQLKGAGKSLTEIGKIIDMELPATDGFVVQGRLTGSTKGLSLLDARGSAKRGGLNLAVNGGIEELLAFKGISFELKASGRELAEIGQFTDTNLPELGPFNASGKISGSSKSLSIEEFTARVDKSDFNGLARVEFLKRPKITVRLESSVIDFTALMKSLEKDEQKTANIDRQKHRLFSDDLLPFEVLKKVDADILMKARNIQAKDARLEFGLLTLNLEDGDFSIDKLEATYKETKISGNLHIESDSPSRVATEFLIQGFNLGDFLKETGKSDQIRAIDDIAAHGKSMGGSVNSLMSKLNGAFGAVMGPGYLTKYLDLLSADLSKKVISFWGRHDKADQIQCAVVQFDIKDGVAASRAFVFNTQIGLLTGEGKINLGTEKIDFLLVPTPREPGLLELSTKLRVSGTILDAKVRPDTLALVEKGALALSALVIGPVGLLAPFVRLGAHKKHPCDIQSIEQLGLNIPAGE